MEEAPGKAGCPSAFFIHLLIMLSQKYVFLRPNTNMSCNEKMSESERNILFEDLFKSHFHQLYVHACGYVQDEECAKDIVHDSYCYLWEHFDRYADNSSFLTLLYTFVRSRCIDHLRQNRVQENYLLQRPEDDVREENDYEDYEQVLERVMAAIRRFPPQTRRVFTDCVFRHLSYKETAEHLGISPLTVKTLMARALKQLRQQKEFFSPVVVLLLHAFSVL